MDCVTARGGELAARYLQGALDQTTAQAYEEHLFECDACFSELRALRLVREELGCRRSEIEVAAPGWQMVRWALPAAAVLALAAGAAVLLHLRGTATATRSLAALAELGRVVPPEYTPVRLRGAGDETARRFAAAMERYSAGDWEGALPGLREVARLDPAAPQAQFYLGATALLASRTEEAVAALLAAVALGETPILEEARFYLAKALARKGDLTAARAELAAVVALGGDRKDEAKRLLNGLGGGASAAP
jgi:tetratricopeptide (TPR) repeat protein